MVHHIWDLHKQYTTEDRDNNSLSEPLCVFETPLGVVLGMYTSSFFVVVSMSVSTSHSEPRKNNKNK